MRTAAVVLLLAAVAVAQPPGGSVVRPGGGGIGKADAFPEKRGYWLIKPGGSTSRPVLAAQQPPVAPAPKPAEPAADGLGPVLFESWDAAYLRGIRVGYYHTLVREHVRDGRTYRYGTRTQKLTVGRFGGRAEIALEESTVETTDGAVVAAVTRQDIGKAQKLTLTGTVRGRQLDVVVDGPIKDQKSVPFPDGVCGVYREAGILAARRPKPGESFEYSVYLGLFTSVVRMSVTCKGPETVTLDEGGSPRELIRLEQDMEPVGGVKVLPPATIWVDPKTWEPLKLSTDAPMFGGTMVIRRTTREEALRPITGPLPELNDVQSVRLDRDIPDVHGKASVTYRVTLSGDLAPEKAFRLDPTRQRVTREGKPFDLTVSAALPPPAVDAQPVAAEFLGTSYFIDWDTPEVKAAAKAATAELPDTATALEKAQAVERWVRRNMRAADYSQSMATCSATAKALSGDCTEYSMLACGMCRALGVPSRTALGLIYASGAKGEPILAYHMWFEVSDRGRWVGLDGTLARGAIGPGHVKISDHSWDKVQDFQPLLPVMSLLGSAPKVEVAEVK